MKQVEANGKQFFALPMERKLSVRAPDFVFGYTGGSPIKWKSKWWLEGLMIKVRRGYSLIESVKNRDMFSILAGTHVIW